MKMNTLSCRPLSMKTILDNEIFQFSILDSETMFKMEFPTGILSPPNSETQDSNSTGIASPMSQNMMSPDDIYVDYKPQLFIREQPIEKFRFRYKSEMAGTHGCLTGRNSDRTKKISYPTVELLHFHRPAIIRCSLYTADRRSVHAHRLMHDEKIDPHDIEVNADNGYEAVFSNMGIIHTAKKHVQEELIKKKQRLLKEKKGEHLQLTLNEKSEINHEVSEEIKYINLNIVCLCFEAFEKRPDNSLVPICEKIFSETINNRKSALTGELKICRMDKSTSSCAGGEVIFMFVEKVVKKNITVRFFEVDKYDKEVWSANGIFNDLDVHHQYAIALKTPPYRLRDIEKPVQVYVELVRPTDGDRSEPREFTYKPQPKIGAKRSRYDSTEIQLPSTIEALNISDTILNPQDARQAIADTAEGLNSDDFNAFVATMGGPMMLTYKELLNSGDIQALDAGGMRNSDGRNSNSCIPVAQCDGYGIQVRSVVQSHDYDMNHEPRALPLNIINMHVGMSSEQLCNDSGKSTRSTRRDSSKWEDPEFLIAEVVSILKKTKRVDRTKLPAVLAQVFSYQTSDKDNALHMAIKHKNMEAAKFLIRILGETDSADIINRANAIGETVLHRAVTYGLLEVTRALIAIRADPNVADAQGNTPFHVVLLRKSPTDEVKLIEELLKAKSVEPDMENYDGYTPLHLAAQKGNLDICKLLLKAGANINRKCKCSGNAVIHMATLRDDPIMLEYFLKQTEVNVNAQNYSGFTALHFAVSEMNIELCRILRHYKADPEISSQETVRVKAELDDEDDDSVGFSSIQLAYENQDILNILKTEPMSPLHTPEISIKQEEDDLNMDIEEGMFDEICLRKLAAICDGTLVWENLVELLECGQYISVLRQASSPTTMLLSKPELNVTVDTIRSFFDVLDVHEAVEIIDEMKHRQGLAL